MNLKYYGLIYKTTNLINNKPYIGQTTDEEYWKSGKYKGSGSLFKKAIKKYGFNNFKSELICYANSQEELNDLEIKYISEFNSIYPNGYNIKLGGNNNGKQHVKTKDKIRTKLTGTKHSEETKIKMSLARKGKTVLEETKEKLRQANLGKKISEETKQKMIISKQNISKETKIKMSNSHIGKNLTNKTKEKIAKSHIGKKHSEVTKEKISKGNKNKIISEKTKSKMSNSQKGRILSESTKDKIAQTLKNKPMLQCTVCLKQSTSVAYINKYHNQNCYITSNLN